MSVFSIKGPLRGVFFTLMGPPDFQGHGTTRRAVQFFQGHGTT